MFGLRILATNGAQLGGSDFDEALMAGLAKDLHHWNSTFEFTMTFRNYKHKQ